MSTPVPTLDQLVTEALADIREAYRVDSDVDHLISCCSGEVVPDETATLFAMVVADVELGMLPIDGDATELAMVVAETFRYEIMRQVRDVLDDEPLPDLRTPLEAFQEDNEDEILDDIREGRRNSSGRLIQED